MNMFSRVESNKLEEIKRGIHTCLESALDSNQKEFCLKQVLNLTCQMVSEIQKHAVSDNGVNSMELDISLQCVYQCFYIIHRTVNSHMSGHRWSAHSMLILYGLAKQSCRNIISVITRTTQSEELVCGNFIQSSDALLGLLEQPDTDKLCESLRLPLEKFISHAITVGQSSGNDEIPITKVCKQVLDSFNSLIEMESKDVPGHGQFVATCERMKELVEVAEHLSNTSLLRSILRSFSSHYKHLDIISSTEPGPSRKPAVDQLIGSHDLQTDGIFQLCQLAAACSVDDRCVVAIQAGLQVLDSLEPELYPAAAALREDPSPQHSQQFRETAALWCHLIDAVKHQVDSILDPTAFVHVAECEAAILTSSLKTTLKDGSAVVTVEACTILAQAQRVAEFAANQLTSESDKLQLLVSKLNKVIAHSKCMIAVYVEDQSTNSAHRMLCSLESIVSYLKQLRCELEESADAAGESLLLSQSRTTLAQVQQAMERLDCPEDRQSEASEPAVSAGHRSSGVVQPADGDPANLSLDISKYLSRTQSRFSRRRSLHMSVNLSNLNAANNNVSSHC